MDPQMTSKVSITTTTDGVKAALERCLRLVGGLDSIIHSGDKVFVKANMLAGYPPETGATTNPEVLNPLLNMLLEITDDVTLVESNFGVPHIKDGPMTVERSIDKVFDLPQYREPRKLGVKTLNLSKAKQIIYESPDLMVLKGQPLPEDLRKADIIVNVPVLKTHDLTTVTLGLKNLYGLIGEVPVRKRLHPVIADALCDLATLFRSDLTVIDGTIGMEGGFGPCFGAPVYNRVLIASRDVVAADSVGAEIMGHPAKRMKTQNPILRAEERGLGTADPRKIEILGEDVQVVRRTYDLRKDLPIRIVEELRNAKHIDEGRILNRFSEDQDLTRRYLKGMRIYGLITESDGEISFNEAVFNESFLCRACGECAEWNRFPSL
jgi:uncharacterized protein (DUF362 family)